MHPCIYIYIVLSLCFVPRKESWIQHGLNYCNPPGVQGAGMSVLRSYSSIILLIGGYSSNWMGNSRRLMRLRYSAMCTAYQERDVTYSTNTVINHTTHICSDVYRTPWHLSNKNYAHQKNLRTISLISWPSVSFVTAYHTAVMYLSLFLYSINSKM